MSGVTPRSGDLRLAHLHLRTGAHALARVELETLAGADRLDRAGILDLAEVRWRTGDLAGADAAATAWREDGDAPGPDSALSHAISAEAAAGRGAAGEAAAHAEAAAAALGDRGAWEVLLAGILPRAPWPWSVETPLPPDDVAPAEPGIGAAWPQAAGAPPAEAAAGSPVDGAAAGPTGGGPGGPPVPLAPAAAELVRAGAPLVGVAPGRAAVLLALALRADRAAAEAVLDALDAAAGEGAPAEAIAPEAGGPSPVEAEHAAALAFVRAEALRAAGRHEEARIAYASAERLALAPAEAGPPGSPQ